LSSEQALRFARILQSFGRKPTLISFDNTRHSDYSDDDLPVLYGIIESFLSRCLGGPALPLDPAGIARSSMRVMSDSGVISGLKAAVPADRYSVELPVEDASKKAKAQ